MRLRSNLAVLGTLMVTVAACGGTSPDAPDDAGAAATDDDAVETPDDAAEETASEEVSDAAGEEVTISTPTGEVVLDAPAERVVALEWTYAEDLVSVGVQPVGVADVASYGDYVDIDPQLDAEVADVGTRQEPSLESIAALEPDLIVGVDYRHEPILDQLEAIAPTVLFSPYATTDDAPSAYEEMDATFLAIAAAVDRTAEAEQVLADVDDQLQALADDLAGADVTTTDIALSQAYTAEQIPAIRMFNDESLAIQILERVGLSNAWDGEPDPYGFNTVDVEALTSVEDATFLYTALETDDPFTGAIADNPIWQDLAFVQEDRVVPIGGDAWTFGGPLSAVSLAERVVDGMVGVTAPG